MDIETTEKQIVANCFHFHSLLQASHDLASQGNLNSGAGLAQHAGHFAWYNSTGYMVSRELEEFLLDIGRKILPTSPRANREKERDSKRRVLHVLTASYGVGGHTRLAWRWINKDTSSEHSVLLTQQGECPIPVQLETAARNAGGEFINIEAPNTDYLERARKLREVADRHDMIVLHQHPHDVVPTIAFATLTPEIPVIYLNHVSFVFWVGVSVSNLVLNLAKGCVDFCVERRGIPLKNCSSILPIPVDLPQTTRSREQIRKILGISRTSTILFSSGSGHKYTPVSGIDFRDFVRAVLRDESDCHLVIAGPVLNTFWAELEQQAPGRVHPLGLIDEQLHHDICKASDIYLDSLPLGSGTSILEAACLGLPVLVFSPPEWKEANLSFEQDNIPKHLHFFDDKTAYIERLKLLTRDRSARRYYGNAVGGLVRRSSMGALWHTMLADAYEQAAETRRRKPRGTALFQRISGTDVFLCQLQTLAGNTQNVEAPRLHDKTVEEVSALLEPAPTVTSQDRARNPYRAWIDTRRLDELDARIFQEHANKLWKTRHLFEFCLILNPGDEALLANSIDSISEQYYDGWRLSIFAQSPSPEIEFTRDESIVRWMQIPEQADTTAFINEHLIQTPANWIGFFESGTRFAPQLLLLLADYLAIHPDWRLVYTDEDALGDDEERCSPLFKPDFNLELLRSTDYIGPLFVERNTLISAGGYSRVAGAESLDIALSVADTAGESALGHIPDVLLHVPTTSFKRASDEGAAEALRNHLARCHLAGDISFGLVEGTTRHITYQHASAPKVSIIVPTRNRLDLLQPCVGSLFQQTRYPDWELLLVDNESDDPTVLAYYDTLRAKHADRVRVLRFDSPFNFSAMNNLAVCSANGDYLLLLNNDTECIHDDWLDAMMAHAQRPDVGIVGARLLFPDSLKIQHAGVILGMTGSAGHPFLNSLTHDEPGYLNRAQVDQEFSAVTGACLLIRKAIYEEVGGLDEQAFRISFNDIDLCLRVKQRGYRIIWTPFATLLHHGSATQVTDAQNPQKIAAFQQEGNEFYRRWTKEMASDPAWNRNLSLRSTDPVIEDELAVPWNTDFHDRPRILVMPVSSPGAAEYRNLGPLRALHAAGRVQYASVCQPRADFERAPMPVELARLAPDALVMHAPVDNVRGQALLRYARYNPDIFRIYALDDLITHIPESNPTFRALPADAIAERLELGLKACNRLIVSTEPLMHAYRHLIDDIRLLPNSLAWSTWGTLQPQRRRGRKLRVGWAGAQQHAGDLRFMREVVAVTNKDVDWVFFGMLPEGARPHVAEFHDYTHDFSAYPAKLASLDLDLAVAPLEVHPFNEAKSNLRLLEYGILGWPVICTDIFPYRTDAPPVTRLPNDPARWIAAIRERVAEPDALAAEGDVLREWVKKHYLLEQRLDQWFDAYSPESANSRPRDEQ